MTEAEMDRLLWNFASGIRNMVASDISPERVKPNEALKQLDDAVKDIIAAVMKKKR